MRAHRKGRKDFLSHPDETKEDARTRVKWQLKLDEVYGGSTTYEIIERTIETTERVIERYVKGRKVKPLKRRAVRR